MIRKVWRSELSRVGIFVVLCVASVVLSRYFPRLTIEGELITIGSTRIDLKLPLLWLIPAAIFGDLVARIYDVRYVLNEQGIEATEGIVSLHKKVAKLRYEDLRLVEFDQTLMERFLDIGNIQLGTAASSGIEVVMRGVASPREIQLLVQRERDERQRIPPESEPQTRIGATG